MRYPRIEDTPEMLHLLHNVSQKGAQVGFYPPTRRDDHVPYSKYWFPCNTDQFYQSMISFS